MFFIFAVYRNFIFMSAFSVIVISSVPSAASPSPCRFLSTTANLQSHFKDGRIGGCGTNLWPVPWSSASCKDTVIPVVITVAGSIPLWCQAMATLNSCVTILNQVSYERVRWWITGRDGVVQQGVALSSAGVAETLTAQLTELPCSLMSKTRRVGVTWRG